MSYVSGYSRRPRHSNVGYNDYAQQAQYQGEYGQPYDNYAGYQSYQQPAYAPYRRHSYNGRHGSNIQVLPPESHVITGDDRYYGNGYHSSRRSPVIVSGDGYHGRQQPHVTSSSRYYASNSRGDHIPVVEGQPYRHEVIPFWSYFRRIFGLGPRRSRGHTGRTIHVKRWDYNDLFPFNGLGGTQRHRSHSSLYTM